MSLMTQTDCLSVSSHNKRYFIEQKSYGPSSITLITPRHGYFCCSRCFVADSFIIFLKPKVQWHFSYWKCQLWYSVWFSFLSTTTLMSTKFPLEKHDSLAETAELAIWFVQQFMSCRMFDVRHSSCWFSIYVNINTRKFANKDWRTKRSFVLYWTQQKWPGNMSSLIRDVLFTLNWWGDWRKNHNTSTMKRLLPAYNSLVSLSQQKANALSSHSLL